MKLKYLFHLWVVLALSACGTFSVSVAPGATPPALPDLVVSSIYVTMVDANGRCTGSYQVLVRISNEGAGPADNVTAVETSTGQSMSISRLEAGQSTTLMVPAASPGGTYQVQVDPGNVIPEANELNNNLSFLDATATPAADCLSASTPLPPDVPTAVVDAGAPALPTVPPFSMSGLIYADMLKGQVWKLGPGGVPEKFLDTINASFSPDGNSAVYEQDGDLQTVIPGLGGGNITNSPDRLDRFPQWWSARPSTIVFNTVGVNEAQQQQWTHAVIGYVAVVYTDGSGFQIVSQVPSLTLPALSPDGKTLAYDMGGFPTLYEVGGGQRDFDPALFGYTAGTPQTGVFFTSPSFSPDGRRLTWWVSEDESAPQRHFSLVSFDLQSGTSSTIYTYEPLRGTGGWLPNPVWSPGGGWIAFETRSGATPQDLWITAGEAGPSYRLGLATNPVWSPDQRHLAYVQWPPRSDSTGSAGMSVIEAGSWSISPIELGSEGNTQQTALPGDSVPLAWVTGVPAATDFGGYIPISGWLTYSNANPPYQVDYPPDATLDAKPETLTINIPFQPGTQMTEKSVRIETHLPPPECPTGVPWQAVTKINGVDYQYTEGTLWEQALGGLSFFQSTYSTFHNGFCYHVTLSMRLEQGSGPTPLPMPGEADVDRNVLYHILSTLKLY